MATELTNPIDNYIATFPLHIQELLEEIRNTIKAAAPGAHEAITYGIPTFKLNGNLVHYAGYQHHIGFYPGASGIAHFKKKISKYKNAKGSVQFPINQPLPLNLVTEIVTYRVHENINKVISRKILKKCPNGHTYNKTAAHPNCPVCARALPDTGSFLLLLSAPARRALESKGITDLQKLAGCSEKELLQLHGFGPGSLPKLRSVLKEAGLSFK